MLLIKRKQFSHAEQSDGKVQRIDWNNQGYFRSERKAGRDHREGSWWRLQPDENEADSPFLTHRHAPLAFVCFWLFPPPACFTRDVTQEIRGDPCSWAKMASLSKASAQLICSVHVARRNQHECTCMCARAPKDIQNTITGKGKCCLRLISVPPATPGIPPSHGYHCGVLQKVELVWLTSSPPVFPDQPFPPLLEGINEPLPSEHPPRPLLRASSRVWRSYANTCASKLSTSSCCSLCFVFLQQTHCTKQVVSLLLSND